MRALTSAEQNAATYVPTFCFVSTMGRSVFVRRLAVPAESQHPTTRRRRKARPPRTGSTQNVDAEMNPLDNRSTRQSASFYPRLPVDRTRRGHGARVTLVGENGGAPSLKERTKKRSGSTDSATMKNCVFLSCEPQNKEKKKKKSKTSERLFDRPKTGKEEEFFPRADLSCCWYLPTYLRLANTF